MTKKTRVGMLGVGFLIVLAIVSAACSGSTSNAVDQLESEGIDRNITVYESPT
jgi:hypothetical protein